MPDWAARIARTGMQMLAGGAFTVLFEQVARDVPPGYTPYVLIGSTLMVTAAQNFLEEKEVIPSILKPKGANNEQVRL